MPRADRFSLTSAGLAMPDVGHLSNRGTLNVLLDRAFSGIPAGLPPNSMLIGVFMNFSRLVDKALREYDAARAELLLYLSPGDGLRTSPYLRAIDHMENCISATHRAVLNKRALRQHKIGRNAPSLTHRQNLRLANVRHAIEHSDEKLLGLQKFKSSPPFSPGEPFSLRLANTSMVIGAQVLTYKELVSAMTKCCHAIEGIRGVATGVPSPTFPNSELRTHTPNIPGDYSGMRASEYLKELSRLTVTH